MDRRETEEEEREREKLGPRLSYAPNNGCFTDFVFVIIYAYYEEDTDMFITDSTKEKDPEKVEFGSLSSR